MIEGHLLSATAAARRIPPWCPDAGGGGWWLFGDIWAEEMMKLMKLMKLRRLGGKTHAWQQHEQTRGRRQLYLKWQQQDDRLTAKVCRCAIGWICSWYQFTAPDNDRQLWKWIKGWYGDQTHGRACKRVTFLSDFLLKLHSEWGGKVRSHKSLKAHLMPGLSWQSRSCPLMIGSLGMDSKNQKWTASICQDWLLKSCLSD